jgi:phage shock protein C
MFCTRCGNELRDQDKFCSGCGTGLKRDAVPPPRSQQRLSRPMREAKAAGVCAGVARYCGIDVTVVRVLWVVLTLCPPAPGLIAYVVLWIVMPKDPAPTSVQSVQVAN